MSDTKSGSLEVAVLPAAVWTTAVWTRGIGVIVWGDWKAVPRQSRGILCAVSSCFRAHVDLRIPRLVND